MGAGSSSPTEVAKSISSSKDDLKRFLSVLVPLAEPGTAGRDKRRHEWPSLDSTGGHRVSLAECDGWLKIKLMQAMKKEKKKADRLWRLYRPSYILAFEDANDVNSSDDESHYVTPKEFRIMVADICIYAAMMDCFDVIDGGKIVDNIDDRRISLEEWVSAFPTLVEESVNEYGFAGLSYLAQNKDEVSAEDIFKEMDADGAGMVLLKEWCAFLKRHEIDAGTLVGKTLGMLH